jgi:hypothetical protein
MNHRLRAIATLALLAPGLPTLTGCGAAIYHPRPSPRIQVTSEGSSLVLLKDGHTFGTGIFGSGIEEAVKGNARAEEEAHSYQTKGTAGFVLGLLGSLTSAGGAGLIVGNEVQATPSTDLRIAGLGMAFGGLALSIVGNILSNGAQPHLWNAVNIYNDGLTPAFPAYGAPGYGAPGYPAPGYPGAPTAPGYAPPGYAPQQPGYAPPGYAPQQPGYAPPGYAPRPAGPPAAAAPPAAPAPPVAPAPSSGPVPPPAPPIPPAPPH